MCEKKSANNPQGIEARLCEELLAATVSELGGVSSLAGRNRGSFCEERCRRSSMVLRLPRLLDGSEVEIKIAAGIAIFASIAVLAKELGEILT